VISFISHRLASTTKVQAEVVAYPLRGCLMFRISKAEEQAHPRVPPNLAQEAGLQGLNPGK